MIKLIKNRVNEHKKVLTNTIKKLEKKIFLCSQIISDALIKKKLIIWCGNGGSAADSMHLAAELIGKFDKIREPFRSISLASNSPTLTCISNDFGYENVFSRQIKGIGKKGDVLISISTSGNSPNINKAIKQAKSMDLKTISFLGKKGGKCKNLSDLDLIVPSNSTARIQEMHIMIGHIVCEIVEKQTRYKF